MALARPPDRRSAHEAFRRALERVRTNVAGGAVVAFREAIDDNDIASSYAAYIDDVVDPIAAGQAVAQSLATGYLSMLGAEVVDELEDLAGTTRAGRSVGDGLAPFGPMILGAIANGEAVADAIAFGEMLVSGFVDREITAAADRETEHQVSVDLAAWQWEGIVAPDSCDACKSNEGLHPADEPIYRHNDCACARRWVPSPIR